MNLGGRLMKYCHVGSIFSARVFLSLMLCILVPQLVSAEDYVIGDGDTIQISVWGEKDLSTAATVRPDGKITLQAVGDVDAAGYTPAKLSESLTEKLSSVVKKPIVAVGLTSITNNRIYVFGGGVPPGVSNLPGRTSLLKFLIRLGSLRGADLEHSYIIRNGAKLDVNFYDLFVKGDLSKDVMLKAEDIIYVPDNEKNKIYLTGAVNNPKYIYYHEGLKILDAVMEAGGFNKFAKENSVMVLRNGGKEQVEIRVKMKDLMAEGDLSQNIPLVAGDLVIVKESIF